MSDCEGALHPKARNGITLFNQGRFFEAHEELELAWREEQGKVRRLYQGILEAGVMYLHIRRRNFNGALKVYGRSLKWLKEFPGTCRGTDVGQLRKDMEAAVAEVRRLGPTRMSEFDNALFKPILWKDL